MYLVDTSVWIGFLRGRDTLKVRALEELLSGDEVVGVTPTIIQELLQGADSPARFEELREYLSELACFLPREPVESHVRAARLYQSCRRAGRTPRSSNDCLIAQVAIEHSLYLLHDDRDFDSIAATSAELMLCAVQ
ncbi:MAG: PIN domain-containing protein [Burkholderiales bacterium]|nr:PIN domain-containing protein [Burkholderiales bacterium]